MLIFEGHAIVSADGMIAMGDGAYPPELRNEADWQLYQASLDAAALVVIGRRGHERHPNPGRRRLVLTRSVEALEEDAASPLVTFWNPRGMALHDAIAALGVERGTIAVTGLFDLFLPDYTRFVLAERHDLVLPAGTPCFAAGHPRTVLTAAGLVPTRPEIIDPDEMVTKVVWEKRGRA